MRPAHPLERTVGIAHYVSDADGVGGRLRASPADFRVRELEAFDAQPVDADPGAYPHLVVRATLRDWETNGFAGRLSDLLGISRERVSWAGTKDKRAVTTQLFSIEGVGPDDLPEIEDADVEVVGRAGRPVLFGDLAGNDFEITVRDVARTDVSDVTADLRAFAGGDQAGTDGEAAGDGDDAAPASHGASVGVPNFFGQQRFGSTRPVTHEVGLAVLRGDWEGAALAYAGNPHERESERTREAREHAEAREWQAAIDAFPRALGYERAICHRLAESDDEPSDHREALEQLPENLQTLFVNAAQSSLFNRMLSERLERGLPFHRPVEGDVVCFRDRDAPAGLSLPDPERTQRVTADRVDTVRRHCERGRAFVTAPLVGTETTLADGEQGEIERAVLNDADVDPADFDLPDQWASTGTRRAVLVETDLRIERDETAPALTVEFALPKGSYATVLLREYLKCDPADL